MQRRTAVAASALTLAIGLPVTAAAVNGPAPGAGQSLTGTWQVTVDPGPGPDGIDPPAFQSTISYTDAHTVAEITSRAPSSAGLGTWSRTGASKYAMTFMKYRFDPTGKYIGRTLITERIVVEGKHKYTSTATTQVVDAAGAVVAQFTSTAVGRRLEL